MYSACTNSDCFFYRFKCLVLIYKPQVDQIDHAGKKDWEYVLKFICFFVVYTIVMKQYYYISFFLIKL